MTRLVLLGLSFFGALAVPALAQTTKKFQQGTNGYSGAVDTYIDKIAPHDVDWYGNADRIEIRNWNGGVDEKMNILIMFDVSSLPSNATITSAKLTLYNTRARGHNSNDVVVLEKVTSAWTFQSSWSQGVPGVVASGVTCPPVTNPPYLEDPPLPPAATQAYVITGMESLVQSWLATPLTNYGVMLSSTVSDINFRFASSDYPTVAVRPELEVIYTTPNVTPPPTVTVTPPSSPAASSPITVSGTASATSPATLTQVTWSNALSGASGTATGTTAWTATIPLVNGNNPITVTVTDSNGGTTSTSFNVGYFPPRVAGKGDDKPCGMGVAGGSPGSLAVAALALALLLAATCRRPA